MQRATLRAQRGSSRYPSRPLPAQAADQGWRGQVADTETSGADVRDGDYRALPAARERDRGGLDRECSHLSHRRAATMMLANRHSPQILDRRGWRHGASRRDEPVFWLFRDDRLRDGGHHVSDRRADFDPILRQVRVGFSNCHDPETHVMDIREALDQGSPRFPAGSGPVSCLSGGLLLGHPLIVVPL
jgi:hypothetical protein